MILANLLRRKVRTLFTIVGVGVGISLMVTIFTLSDDLVGQVDSMLLFDRGDILAMSSGSTFVLDSQVKLLRENGLDVLTELEAMPIVSAASPAVMSFLRTERSVGAANQIDYYGVTPNSPIIRRFAVALSDDGKPLHEEPEGPLLREGDNDGFLVGDMLFNLANDRLPEDKKLKIGQRINLTDLLLTELADFFVESGNTFKDLTPEERKIQSTLRLGNSGVDALAALGMNLRLRGVVTAPQPLMRVGVYFPLVRAQQLKGYASDNRVTAVFVELNDTSDSGKDRAVAELTKAFPDLLFRRSDQILGDMGQVQFARKFSWGISLIAAIAGVIGVANILALSVHERTREIGLLLSLGWNRGMVLRMILGEGMAITTIGALAAVGFGYLEMVAVVKVLDIVFLTPRIDPALTGLAIGLALALGFLASIYPAWRASRLTPMDALRNE